MLKLETLIDEFLIYLRVNKNFSIRTLESYGLDLQQFSTFFDTEPISGVEYIDHLFIRRYLSKLKEKQLSRTSIARKISCLRSFFKFLCRQEYISNNPIL